MQSTLHLPFLLISILLHLPPLHASSTCPTLLNHDPPPSTSTPTPRVVNGDLISPTLLPSLVALFVHNKTSWTAICSGVLISPLWLLTAAHCNLSSSLHVLLLAQNTNHIYSDRSHFMRIRRAVPHPRYVPSDTDNPFDIMLIKLRKRVPGVATMALNVYRSIPVANSIARIAGYGITSEGSRQRDRWAMQVDIPVVSTTECARRYSGMADVDASRHVCAGYLDVEGRGCGGCNGDSGGPLFQYTKEGRAVVVAVVSSGMGCAREEFPTLYVGVAPHEEWMRRVMKKEFPGGGARVESVFLEEGKGGVGVGGILGILVGLLVVVVASWVVVVVVRRRSWSLRRKRRRRGRGEDVVYGGGTTWMGPGIVRSEPMGEFGGGVGMGLGMGMGMASGVGPGMASGVGPGVGLGVASGMESGVGLGMGSGGGLGMESGIELEMGSGVCAMNVHTMPVYEYDAMGHFQKVGEGNLGVDSSEEAGKEEVGRNGEVEEKNETDEGATGVERRQEERNEKVNKRQDMDGFDTG